jgi:Arc/MetJ-type ribon-helix-helix transcriptional regulator
VIQHGIGLVEREEQEHRARLDAIRADLDRRAAEPPITMDELDQLLADWRAKRESNAA